MSILATMTLLTAVVSAVISHDTAINYRIAETAHSHHYNLLQETRPTAPLPRQRPERLVPAVVRTTTGTLGVFESTAISAAKLPTAGLWHAARAANASAVLDTGCHGANMVCATPFAGKLRAIAAEASRLEGRALLDHVNSAVNQSMRYQADASLWGVGDYWADPADIAQKGAGDCEDFALTKFWLLRELGIAEEQMQLVILQNTRRQLFHAVLVVHTATGAYVLDNVNSTLRQDTAYAQYTPIMSFSGSNSYIHGFASGSARVAAMPRNLASVMPGMEM
jgi:predicted transglutaminase-like cysteine proteinase